MKKLGLLGSNISYSISPKLHNLIKEEYKLNFNYELVDIKEIELKEYIDKLKKGIYYGYNITIPFKEEVIKHLDVLTPAAKYINAVNTVYLKDGKVVGDNTDYLGFEHLLNKVYKINKDDNFYILGSGGAAKACMYVLKENKLNFTVVSRTKKENDSFKIITYGEFYKAKKIDVLINTTSLGNINNPKSPIKKFKTKIKTIIDLTYNPLKTKLMELSNNSYNGLDMLIVQAIYSQNRWFNNININNELIDKIKGELENELVREII